MRASWTRWYNQIWWAEGWQGQGPAGTRWAMNDKDFICSWIRLRTSRSGSSYGLHCVSSDKGREVRSWLPYLDPAAPLTLGSIHGHQLSNCPAQLLLYIPLFLCLLSPAAPFPSCLSPRGHCSYCPQPASLLLKPSYSLSQLLLLGSSCFSKSCQSVLP